MNDKIYTCFVPGSYGTYLSWAVDTYSSIIDYNKVEKPFDQNGSAHLYRIRKTKKIEPIHELYDFSNNIIFIKPSNFLDYLDNHFTKQWESDLSKAIDKIFPNFIEKSKSYPDNHNQHRWQIRELWSFYLPAVLEASEKKYKDIEHSCKEKNTIFVNANDILLDFTNTLADIFNFFNLTQTVPTNYINNIHIEYMNLQKHVNKSKLVVDIVDKCLQQKFMNIDELTIFDEAIIQHLFRQKGIEMKSYNLNEFPKNTQELYRSLNNPSYKGNASTL